MNGYIIDTICSASGKRGTYDKRAVTRFRLRNFKRCIQIAFAFRIGIVFYSYKHGGCQKQKNDYRPPKAVLDLFWSMDGSSAVTVFSNYISILIGCHAL